MCPNCAKKLSVGDGCETNLNPLAFFARHVMVAWFIRNLPA
jgi:hypothetical protein